MPRYHFHVADGRDYAVMPALRPNASTMDIYASFNRRRAEDERVKTSHAKRESARQAHLDLAALFQARADAEEPRQAPRWPED